MRKFKDVPSRISIEIYNGLISNTKLQKAYYLND